jgi:hypothetical protein
MTMFNYLKLKELKMSFCLDNSVPNDKNESKMKVMKVIKVMRAN